MFNNLTTQEIDRVIEMAWEDRTPFEAINFYCRKRFFGGGNIITIL